MPKCWLTPELCMHTKGSNEPENGKQIVDEKSRNAEISAAFQEK